MSFRKRGEVIGNQAVPGRNPLINPRSNAPVTGAGPIPSRNPLASNVGINRGQPRGPAVPVKTPFQEEIAKNPGVRPSIITSQSTISTGCPDLDKILMHQGLPLGSSLLIEESGTTDFASILLRVFASQGIMHNRIEKDQINCHVVVVGLGNQWAKDLPGLYKGTSKEQKKAKIIENESKVSVSNLSNSGSNTRNEKDLKIAWRYGLNKKVEGKDSVNDENYEYYNNQFDITQKLLPGPSAQDITFLPLSDNVEQMIRQITSVITHELKGNKSKTIRLVIPGLLNPSLYSPLHSSLLFIIPLIHALRALLRKYPDNLTLISSIATDLYPRDSSLTFSIESLMDSVIHLQPFNQEMYQLLEKAYKSEPSKIQHGLVNIIKLPVLSERGQMMVQHGVYAFKNGRKRFEIEEWSIPVEDDAKDESSDAHGHQHQTTKNIEF